MKKDEIKEKYESVECILENALKKTKSIHINGDEETTELNNIISVLDEINRDFKLEIEKLEASSEWEKYCVAFFGETNAGKSTIIESLRIIYDEEMRRSELLKHEKEYTQKLNEHCQDYKKLLEDIKEINRALADYKKPSPIVNIIKAVGLMLLGAIIGYMLSALGILGAIT